MLNLSGLTVNTNRYNIQPPQLHNTTGIKNAEQTQQPANHSNPLLQRAANVNIPSFGAANTIRTQLSGKDEQNKYNKLSSVLDKKSRKELNGLLKSGKLLNNSSNDGSTTLDNLYNIITKQGAEGIDRIKVAQDVIARITKPPLITQKFGDIPLNMQPEIISYEQSNGKNVSATDLDVKSSTCPAASIESSLARRMPAEFARMAEGLTSPKVSVEKTINVSDLSQNLVDIIWMLNEFGADYKFTNWNQFKVNLKPDNNAIIRARIQNDYKDPDERSVIDVLMQSTFMNIGAQNTYDSLIDKRVPKYNADDSGLIDIEKNFAEELATGKGKICVTYQKIDDNGRLVGYECEQNETLAHIQNTLNQGDNVIIGYTYCDNNNNVIGGHEITIIGIETDNKGQKYFICNDTDDGVSEPIKYKVDELLPKIHHAGIPKSVLVDNVEFIEGWKELMQIYKETRTQNEVQSAVNNNKLTVLNQSV